MAKLFHSIIFSVVDFYEAIGSDSYQAYYEAFLATHRSSTSRAHGKIIQQLSMIH